MVAVWVIADRYRVEKTSTESTASVPYSSMSAPATSRAFS